MGYSIVGATPAAGGNTASKLAKKNDVTAKMARNLVAQAKIRPKMVAEGRKSEPTRGKVKR